MLAEAERAFPVAAIGNDWLGSTLIQLFAQFVAVIGLVAKHALRWFNSVDETCRDRAVVCLTAGQQDGYEAPLSSCCARRASGQQPVSAPPFSTSCRAV